MVPRCAFAAWKVSAFDESSGSAPSFPSGRGKGLTCIRLHRHQGTSMLLHMHPICLQ